MRLKKEEIDAIKQTAMAYFGEDANVYIFGSRAVDAKKGGDIDLYIETNLQLNPHELYKKKLSFAIALDKKIGEQTIDIVVNNFTDSKYIYEVAKKTGIII
ncbi:MAG: nucleotidyltransferase domain-containing protein [bacterium]